MPFATTKGYWFKKLYLIGSNFIFQKVVFEDKNKGLEENAVKLCNISKDDMVLEVGFGPGIGIHEAFMRIKG